MQKRDYQVELDEQVVKKKIQEANSNADLGYQQQNTRSHWFKNSHPNELSLITKDQIAGFESGIIHGVPGAGYARAHGKRKSMEDTDLTDRIYFRPGDLTISAALSAALAGVFDGHIVDPATITKDKILPTLISRLEQYNKRGLSDTGIWNALRLTMTDLDREIPTSKGGTTACIVIVISNKL